MKAKFFACIFHLAAIVSFSQVDSTVFCLSNKGVPGLYLSRLNVTTGVVTHISPSVIANGAQIPNVTIDPYLGRYYFVNEFNQIIGLDLVTGTVVTSGQISNPNSDNFDQMIFNASDSMIYGLARKFSPPAIYLASIHPSTGVISLISSSSLSNGYVMSGSALDPFTKTYYYINENNHIIGIDLISGNIKSSAPVTNVNGDYFDEIEFNASDKTIYGLARKTGPAEVRLAKINPSTGAVTNISLASLSTSENALNSLFDPCNNVYYYVSELGCMRVNASNGQLINSVVPSHQVIQMKYNFKCHYNFTAFSGIKEGQTFADIELYPNPANNNLNLEMKEFSENTTITISNMLGQNAASFTGKKQLDVSSLPQGCYFVKILLDGKTLYYSKFVKE
jgi:hypothetical protein